MRRRHHRLKEFFSLIFKTDNVCRMPDVEMSYILQMHHLVLHSCTLVAQYCANNKVDKCSCLGVKMLVAKWKFVSITLVLPVIFSSNNLVMCPAYGISHKYIVKQSLLKTYA